MYEPELGQAAFGTWEQYELPEYAKALVLRLLEEFRRIALNTKKWTEGDWKGLSLGSVTYRHFYWGEEEARQSLPNFQFEAVGIKWYKHPGRGMSTNITLDDIQWVSWFNRALKNIRKAEVELLPILKEVYFPDYLKSLEVEGEEV